MSARFAELCANLKKSKTNNANLKMNWWETARMSTRPPVQGGQNVSSTL